jgi:pimeloyl-[acyl-carrier protein] methyl ester esterase
MNMHVSTIGDGPDLALLHGWGLHGGIWQDVVDDLKDKWRISIIDLPGHGDSDMPPGDFTLQTLATEIARALPPSTSLIGWSLGGMVAMQLAADFPQQVERLILVASTPQFVKTGDWPHAIDPQILKVFADNLGSDYRSTIKHFLALQVLGSDDERNTLRRLQQLAFSRDAPDPHALKDGLAILLQENIRQRLPDIKCPTLFVYGQNDRLVPKASGRDVSALLPDATQHMINRAGHAPFLSHRPEFMQTITNFLDEHRPA